MLELIVTSTLNGVLYGMLLFLMASGLTVIFSILGVLNFAHASFYTFFLTSNTARRPFVLSPSDLDQRR